MIKSKYSIKILKIVFNKIVSQLYNTIYDKKYIINDNTFNSNGDTISNNNNSNTQNSFDLLNPRVI